MSTEASMPSPQGRWFEIMIHCDKGEENHATLHQAIIALDVWRGKHAPLEFAIVSTSTHSSNTIRGLLQFESPKTVYNLNRLLSRVVPETLHVSSGIIASQDELNRRAAAAAREKGVCFYYQRNKVRESAPTSVATAASTAALAARYRGNADGWLERSRAVMPQVKHDGIVRETCTKLLTAQPDKKLLIKMSESGKGELAGQRGAFTNVQIFSEKEDVSIHAKLLIGATSIEQVQLFTSAEPIKPFSLMNGAACVPVTRSADIEIELEFPQLQEPMTIRVSYDVVTELMDVNDDRKLDDTRGIIIPPSDGVLRDSIFTQQNWNEKEAERDGSSSFYTVPLRFGCPVTQIEAHIPGDVESAWLLLDYEHHGLYLKKDYENPLNESTWKIVFDTPINFTTIESAKLVYRLSREASVSNRRVRVCWWNLNILRFCCGTASPLFFV